MSSSQVESPQVYAVPPSSTTPAGQSDVDLSVLLEGISATFREIDDHFVDLHQQTDILHSLHPDPDEVLDNVDFLKQDLERHEEGQTAAMEKLKGELSDMVEQTVKDELRENDLSGLVKRELGKQVHEHLKKHVMNQMGSHLPGNFEDQAKDARQQVEVMKIALHNSEARTANARIGKTDLFEPFEVLLTSKGQASGVYPYNLRSLLAYDLKYAHQLNQDYGLETSDVLEMNFKWFLSHIGTRVEIIIPESESESDGD